MAVGIIFILISVVYSNDEHHLMDITTDAMFYKIVSSLEDDGNCIFKSTASTVNEYMLYFKEYKFDVLSKEQVESMLNKMIKISNEATLPHDIKLIAYAAVAAQKLQADCEIITEFHDLDVATRALNTLKHLLNDNSEHETLKLMCIVKKQLLDLTGIIKNAEVTESELPLKLQSIVNSETKKINPLSISQLAILYNDIIPQNVDPKAKAYHYCQINNAIHAKYNEVDKTHVVKNELLLAGPGKLHKKFFTRSKVQEAFVKYSLETWQRNYHGSGIHRFFIVVTAVSTIALFIYVIGKKKMVGSSERSSRYYHSF